MIYMTDVDPYIAHEFGSRLEPLGFLPTGKRKWVRSQKSPIRELFEIQSLKSQYCPRWGLSSGAVPAYHKSGFRRQSTDKSAAMDLVIDPVDISGFVPAERFRFMSGLDPIPAQQIQRCAEHFIPQALEHFKLVQSISDFLRFFQERRELRYRRFTFDMYIQHRLTHGFMLLIAERRTDGIDEIRNFCDDFKMDFDSKVLQEYISKAVQPGFVTV